MYFHSAIPILAKQLLKILPEFRCVIPYMCGELRPEQNTFFIPVFLIIKMMGLMGVTETVKACRTYLLYPCSYLLSAERVTLSELMFVLANSIDKDRLSI